MGDKLFGFFFAAIRTDRIFCFRIHGLQQNEIFTAGFAHVLVKWHETTPFLTIILICLRQHLQRSRIPKTLNIILTGLIPVKPIIVSIVPFLEP